MKTIILHILSYLLILVPQLISIAMLTVIERKVMGSMQRRLGPNVAGVYGILQPIADALKLSIKQFYIPYKSVYSLYILAPILSFLLSLFLFSFISFTFSINNNDYQFLLFLALNSLSIYGILLSGWSSNCVYSLLGSIRSSAQLISYELSITLIIISLLYDQSYSFFMITHSQACYYNILVYFPISILYFISILAETNRAPFDLPEAESELVSGFNTEHSSLPFAYFFLAEYSTILAQSIIFVNLFLGSYYLPFIILPEIFDGFIIITKTTIIIYLFVLIRATIPRLRYDLLQDLAWNTILPISIVYLFLNL